MSQIILADLPGEERLAALLIVNLGNRLPDGWGMVVSQPQMARLMKRALRTMKRLRERFSVVQSRVVSVPTGRSCEWYVSIDALNAIPSISPLSAVDSARLALSNQGDGANLTRSSDLDSARLALPELEDRANLAPSSSGGGQPGTISIYEERAPVSARSSSSSNKHTDQDLLGAEDGGQGGSAPKGLIPSHSERSIPRASASALDWLSVPSAEVEAWSHERKMAALEDLMAYVGLNPSTYGIQRDAWLMEALRPSGRPLKAFLWSIHTAAARGAFQPVDGALETRDGKKLLGSVGRFLRNTTPEEYDNKAPAAQAAGGGYRGGRQKLPNSSIRETWNQPPSICEHDLVFDDDEEVDLEGL